MARASGHQHSPHRRASPGLPVHCASRAAGNGCWQQPTDPSWGCLGHGGRQTPEGSFAGWAPWCQRVHPLRMAQKHGQKHKGAGMLQKCCPDNQVLVHIRPSPCPASVSPSGCCKPSKLCECLIVPLGSASSARSLLEKQKGGFAPSLFSKPPFPEPLQPHRKVFASSLIPPGKDIGVQPWSPSQPAWGLLCHFHPLR